MIWGWILGLILILIGIVLINKAHKQIIVDNDILNKYNQAINSLQVQKNKLDEDVHAAERKLNHLNNDYHKVIDDYNNAVQNQQSNLKKLYDERQRELDSTYNAKIYEAQARYDKTEHELTEKLANLNKVYNETSAKYKVLMEEIDNDFAFKQNQFNALLEPFQLYEKDQQQRLFYTIQIPEVYKPDIDYLLTNVSPKVQHPDIINKLIWSEYIRPALDDTFKRVGIEDKPGIYKLTNINSNKCYIGKSTNIKKRIQDHIKAAIGIVGIADQAVHHAMLETGIWNWSIEYITYCEKEQLNELEKYYIEFFKARDFGYNKTGGGEG